MFMSYKWFDVYKIFNLGNLKFLSYLWNIRFFERLTSNTVTHQREKSKLKRYQSWKLSLTHLYRLVAFIFFLLFLFIFSFLLLFLFLICLPLSTTKTTIWITGWLDGGREDERILPTWNLIVFSKSFSRSVWWNLESLLLHEVFPPNCSNAHIEYLLCTEPGAEVRYVNKSLVSSCSFRALAEEITFFSNWLLCCLAL